MATLKRLLLRQVWLYTHMHALMCTCTYTLRQNLPGTYSTCSVSQNPYYCIKITASHTSPRQFQRHIHNWFTKSLQSKKIWHALEKNDKILKSQLKTKKNTELSEKEEKNERKIMKKNVEFTVSKRPHPFLASTFSNS